MAQFLIEEALLTRVELEDALAQRRADEEAAAAAAVDGSRKRLEQQLKASARAQAAD